MDSASGPWATLRPGDRIRVASVSKNVYEVTALLCGAREAGLYVRRSGRLGRLLYERLDPGSLELLGQGETLEAGDDVTLALAGGDERRGRVVGPHDVRLELALAGGRTFTAPLERLRDARLWIHFRAPDLRPGDAFRVRSRSGRELRGRCLALRPGAVVAEIDGAEGRVRLAVDRLDLRSLDVLVPLPLEAVAEGV